MTPKTQERQNSIHMKCITASWVKHALLFPFVFVPIGRLFFSHRSRDWMNRMEIIDVQQMYITQADR